MHTHEGKNIPMKLQDRIPTPQSDVACTEEQRNKELMHDLEDGPSMITTLAQQPQEVSTLHQGSREESAEEETKTEPVADDIVVLARVTPDRDCNTLVSQSQAEVCDRHQDSSTETKQLGDEETQIMTSSVECGEGEQPAQHKGYTLTQATKDKDIGTLHVATEEVLCDEPNVKKISPSGSEASNKGKSSVCRRGKGQTDKKDNYAM